MPRPIIQGPYRTFRRLTRNETFLEFEGSTITIDLKARKAPNDPWMHEELKLRAFMRLEIFPPYINNLGTREFQFIIRDWWLNGKSEMLSELFYDDPRGHWLGNPPHPHPRHRDFVPATVTFRVSNNYEIDVDEGAGLSAGELFAPARDLEIRNLTSHDLRTWSDIRERDEGLTYSLPGNRLYWQIVSADTLAKADLKEWRVGKGPVLVFHKKPGGDFSIANDRDRASYLLALHAFDPEQRDRKNPGGFVAQGPGRPLEALKVQQMGNVTLSPLYRPRAGLEIRWGLAAGLDIGKLATRVRSKPISGSIRIVSPARSLGTADQGPDVGDPIDSCDFPARITYAINYSIAVNEEQFVEDQAGIAIAVGVDDVPPRDVTVAFDKPHIGHVLSRYLEFGPGHCTGMHEISQDEYDLGVNFCRYWRTVPLDPNAAEWASFEDFDPTREY
jgi:hypothetical protein